MCGIIGYIGTRQAAPLLLDSLKKLEYRGYDSAGIAVLDRGEIAVRRSEGKLAKLEELLRQHPVRGTTGIGHTRWATHGKPSERNAHPHRAGDVVVVHNGIIENYLDLKESLGKTGVRFGSDTDSEIVAHLVNEKIRRGATFSAAVRQSLKEIEGSYALVFLNRADPDRLIVAKNSSAVVVGFGDGEAFVASDIPALLDYTRTVVFFEDGEIGELSAKGLKLTDGRGKSVKRPAKEIGWDPVAAQKGGYRHFMSKEIHDQPQAITDTIRGRVAADGQVSLDELPLTAREIRQIERIHLVACGTAWHAALVGKFMFEEIARLPTDVDYASEFRYRAPLFGSRSLLIPVSQSGETADTLATLAVARGRKVKIVSICNIVDSSLARKSDGVFYTRAGPEISVASTKAFTTQLTALYLLAVGFAQVRGALKKSDVTRFIEELRRLPGLVEETLGLEGYIELAARELAAATDVLYLGRGINYPVALEGALKLKEISYIHAEGYPAGEMKHGPIALVDESLPVVVLLPKDRYFRKTLGNLKEAESRGAKPIVLTDEHDGAFESAGYTVLRLPRAADFLTPIVMTVPLQLLAYHTAVGRGTDVDQPRNLAKSVTVE